MMVYRESGWTAEVELLSEERDEKGIKMTFRIVQTLLLPDWLNPDATPKDGEIFAAWKSHDSGGYAGWNVSDY